MKKEEIIHLGDGVYLYFNGYSFELRANHHETPSDTVYLDPDVCNQLVKVIMETNQESS